MRKNGTMVSAVFYAALAFSLSLFHSVNAATPNANEVIVYYKRADGNYTDWGLHIWDPGRNAGWTDWASPLPWEALEADGAVFRITLPPNANYDPNAPTDYTGLPASLGFIAHIGNLKDGGDNFIDPTESNVWYYQQGVLQTTPFGDGALLAGAGAHWLDHQTLAWNPGVTYDGVALYSSAGANLVIEANDVTNATHFGTTATTLSSALQSKFPHLQNLAAFTIDITAQEARDALKGQVIAVAWLNGQTVAATRVQIPGVVDDLMAYDGELGVNYANGQVSATVWAPTATQVNLKRYDAAKNLLETVTPTAHDPNTGVYTFTGSSDWDRSFYRYDVTVFHPLDDAIHTWEVTDPYSISLSTNSKYSQFVDLANDSSLKPAGWDAMIKALPLHSDITLYEGHVRDFSLFDQTVASADRGKFKAFSYVDAQGNPTSDGMTHLKALSDAGLTHFHLLPVFDISTINEDPSEVIQLEDNFETICTRIPNPTTAMAADCASFTGQKIKDVFAGWASTSQATEKIQEVYTSVSASEGMKNRDGFNWGYDPYHYGAPEGSYAKDPEGAARILEFREMVAGLHAIGLNVVMDVVYNHTSASGFWDNSVLDKIVPGYYHRLNPTTGRVENSTCCDNTAVEHFMMEKLMVDTLVIWAKYYKIDSFRFDLMGHHPKSSVVNSLLALQQLTPEQDGVQGSRIYLYGEGWNFGEIAYDSQFTQATQFNMAGTRVGTFNDRIRSAVRGGNFTDKGFQQGVASGQAMYSNGKLEGNNDRGKLLDFKDTVRIGMAGNLQNYEFISHGGLLTKGKDYGFGCPDCDGVGYTFDPQENVSYIDKHDNESLWDNTQAKLPWAFDTDTRARIQLLSQAYVNYGQGVPFHQMGTDLLRSKSMDRNTYDSGDWFNAVFFDRSSNNWGVGKPLEGDNGNFWTDLDWILTNPNIVVTSAVLDKTASMFQEQLKVRYSSQLFRLETDEQIDTRVKFHNTGPSQIDGLIAMSISDAACAGEDLDPDRDGVMVLINSDDEQVQFTAPFPANFVLHPILATSVDPLTAQASYSGGIFTIPKMTAAVFYTAQGDGGFNCGTLNQRGFSVFFKKPSDWDWGIRAAYTSNQAGEVPLPGRPMQPVGQGWYVYTMPANSQGADFWFTDGENTTDLLPRLGSGCYTLNGGWTDLAQCDLPPLTIYVKPYSDWVEPISIFSWEPALNGQFPGEALTPVGDGWYRIQYAANVYDAPFLFNDGNSNRSVDLYRGGLGCFAKSQWLPVCQLDFVDSDNDGMNDDFELSKALDPYSATDASEDADNDGLTNLEEMNAGTDLYDNDTDGDGLVDGSDPHPLVPDNNPGEPTRYDQNGDGKADVIWRSDTSGQNWLYGMNGHVIEQSKPINTVNDPWRMIGRGDFNGDGKGDMLWRNDDTGANFMYLMDGASITSGKVVNVVPIDSGWDIESIGDYNGDGRSDMLWRNADTGAIWQYQMNGTAIILSRQVTTIGDSQWSIISSRDFNNDGNDDVLLRHQTTGVVWLYLMEGNNIVTSKKLMEADISWQLVIAGDFDGDGDSDILWRNTSDGRNYVYLLNQGVVDWNNRGLISQFSDQNWQAVMAGDFDGDGDDDIWWRHFGDGRNYIYLMDGLNYSGKPVNTVADLTWRPVK